MEAKVVEERSDFPSEDESSSEEEGEEDEDEDEEDEGTTIVVRGFLSDISDE